MKWLQYTTVLLLVAFGACDCDELSLQNSCPAPVTCWVSEPVENVEKNLQLSGFENFQNRGECELGKTACDADGNLFCEGIIYPAEEVCDGRDNDCDGGYDEGFDVDHDGFTICQGDCDDSRASINPGQSEMCNGVDDNCDGIIPEIETTDADGDGTVACFDCDDNDDRRAPLFLEWCDGIDNDCDDDIDEDYADAWFYCGPPETIGSCHGGTNVCVEGEPICLGAEWDSQEVCDGRDNDCDGFTDEGLVQQCFTTCGVGLEYCQVGEWVRCDAPSPTTETCDGLDNDCDGVIDEGCLCLTGDQQLCSGDTLDPDTLEVINCGLGFQECDDAGMWGPCLWVINEPEECDAYDNDCDGVIDEISQPCGESTIGECRLGATTCVLGEWSDCDGVVVPVDEVCDDLDNDCDGEVDEGLTPHEKVDIVFAIDGSGSMCAYTQPLAAGLSQYVTEFENLEHRFALVVFPYISSIADPSSNVPYLVFTDLVEVQQFITILTNLACNFPGYEPSYDVMYDLAHPSNIVNISWRPDAFPYIVMMTDEQPQTWENRQESDVALRTNNCTVGSCVPGDKFEVFVFTNANFFSGWDEPTFFEPSRLISLEPPLAEEYVNKLKTVFTNICL
jgi:hypothetical protein